MALGAFTVLGCDKDPLNPLDARRRPHGAPHSGLCVRVLSTGASGLLGLSHETAANSSVLCGIT